MSRTLFISCTSDNDFTRKMLPMLAHFFQRRFDIAVTDCLADASAVLYLEDRLPEGHAAGSEGFAVTTGTETGQRCYRIVGENLGLLYGAGRLLRKVLRDGQGGIVWPELTLDERPALAARGIYFPFHRMASGERLLPFNAYAAWLYDEGRFDDFEEVIVELMLWGMNTIGIWYAEFMPEPGDGPEGERQERIYRKVVDIARAWRLRVCLLTTATMLPPFPADHPLEVYRSMQIPDGLWSKFEVPGSYCPQHPEIYRRIRDYRDKLISIFQPDWVEVFPTDPGGCECAKCAPWHNTYLDLAHRLLAPWVDRVALRSINFWYFWNRDAAALAAQVEGDPVINTVSTQGAWQESTAARLRISDHLTAQGTRVVLWPDITMNGGWGTYGTYPFPEELGKLFRLSRRQPYGILPYTEGRYDDFNKFAMLALAWNPKLDTAALTRQVMTGMFSRQMPPAALDAIAALEKLQYAQADTLFTRAEEDLDTATINDWRWYSLRFHARHAPLGTVCGKLAKEIAQAKTAGQPISTRTLKHLQRALAAVEARFAAYQEELPELYHQVNDFRRRHQLCCGTTHPPVAELRRRHHLDELRADLHALAGEGSAEKEGQASTTAVDFRVGVEV